MRAHDSNISKLGHVLSETMTRVVVTTGLAACGLVVLWWLADHRRGMRWARSVIGWRFPVVRQISSTALAEWLRDERREPPVLWDVRTREEYETSHLPQAIHVPLGISGEELRQRLEQARGRAMVCYCAAGYRGAEMARRLGKMGALEVYNLAGGIFDWANEAQALMSDGERGGTRVHSYRRLFRRLLRPERRMNKNG
ncbi:rhodanese-related sulfurtransferase [Roseimicrobium gellanilyticum]|uniref:Rhodanese-related sulfurtransferase n=1 Tax=Roseimicrobium gellanilyticum TaxID=748857 RepID=A0A366H7P2_9BACT|nr:rhodanese-related sulfurtransferase [Roseimicrobium gellanilyticum]